MRRLALVMIPFALCAATPALAGDAAVEAPIRQFVDSFNKGDTAGALATMADKASIIDEVTPFHWHGKDALATWGADNEADAKARGIDAQSVVLGTPTRELVAGTHAYVIVPATYRFTQAGVKMAEAAQITFTLEQGAAGWKITGWTWTGPDATPAG